MELSQGAGTTGTRTIDLQTEKNEPLETIRFEKNQLSQGSISANEQS